MSQAALTGEVLGYLNQRYAGYTALSALWEWAGGDAGLAPDAGPSEELWSEGWRRAEAGEGQTPDPVALLREALYDERGHPLLLDYLAERAALEQAERLADLDLLLVSLERAALVGAAPALVGSVLRSFPFSRWQDAFALLAPSLEEWLSDEQREPLIAACQAIEARLRVAEDARALRAELRAIEDEEAAGAAVESARERIKEILRRAERELPRQDPLRVALERIVNRLAFRTRLTLRATIASLTSVLVEVDLLPGRGSGGGEGLAGAAEGLRAALWATRPLPGEEEAEVEDDLSLPDLEAEEEAGDEPEE